MALNDERKRRVYLYLGVIQASAEGTPGALLVTPVTHRLAAALDSLSAGGETTVIELLEGRTGPPAVVGLDTLWSKLWGVDESMLASRVEEITLNPAEFQLREQQFNRLLARLDSTLFPDGDGVLGGGGAGGSGLQGPFFEP